MTIQNILLLLFVVVSIIIVVVVVFYDVMHCNWEMVTNISEEPPYFFLKMKAMWSSEMFIPIY
jgi:hypothetical protein